MPRNRIQKRHSKSLIIGSNRDFKSNRDLIPSTQKYTQAFDKITSINAVFLFGNLQSQVSLQSFYTATCAENDEDSSKLCTVETSTLTLKHLGKSEMSIKQI